MSEFEITKALANILIEICKQWDDNEIGLAEATDLANQVVSLLVWIRGRGRAGDDH